MLVGFSSIVQGDITVQPGGNLVFEGPPAGTRVFMPTEVGEVWVRGTVGIPSYDGSTPPTAVGGTAVVQDRAVVSMARFSVETYAELRCEAGSELRLRNRLGDLSFIGGRFIARGTEAKRVTLKADAQCLTGQGFAWIMLEAFTADANESLLLLEYADITNLAFDGALYGTSHMPLAPIRHCTFTADENNLQRDGVNAKAVYNLAEYQAAPGPKVVFSEYFLRFQGPHPAANFAHRNQASLAALGPDVGPGKVEVYGCRFTHTGGDEQAGESRIFRGEDEYKIGGLEAYLMTKVQVSQANEFEFLTHGVFARRTTDLIVEGNSFRISNFGAEGDAASMNICNNSFDRVEFCSKFTHSGNGAAVYDNEFNNVSAGVWGLGNELLSIRNNRFVEYVHGVRAQASVVDMDIHQSGLVNGFNTFEFGSTIADFSNPTVPEFLPFQSETGDVRVPDAHDLHFYDDCDIRVQCGYNEFAGFSFVHMFNQSKELDPTSNVDVNPSVNAWWQADFSFQVRLLPDPGITLISPQNLDQEDDTDASCIADPVVPGGLCTVPGAEDGCQSALYVNIGEWGAVPDIAFFDTVFTTARVTALDPFAAEQCRRSKAFDALEAALRSSATGVKLAQLLTDFRSISQETNATPRLQALGHMLKGVVHEYLAEPDSAAAEYTIVTTQYGATADSLLAAWRIAELGAVPALDPAQPVPDSVVVAASNFGQVLADIRSQVTFTGGSLKQGRQGAVATVADSLVTLEQNAPNPFDGVTQIRYSLAEGSFVHLVVSDALGRDIRTLAAGYHSAGEYTVAFVTDGLPDGVYYYRLVTASGVHSRQMLLLH